MSHIVDVKLTEQQKETLTKLERFHELDNILLFRQIAMDKVAKRKEQIEQQKIKKREKSIFSFGKKKAKQFFSHIHSNSSNVKYQIEFNGGQVSLELLDLSNERILVSELNGLMLNCFIREGTICLQSSLKQISMRDHVTTNSQFPKILFHSTSTLSFFNAEILISPGALVEYKVSATMKPMTIVPAPLLFRKLNLFVQPTVQQEAVNDLELALLLKFQELKQNAQRKLKELLQQGNINVALQLELCGPQLLLTSQLEQETSPLLILSLGNLSIHNEEFTEANLAKVSNSEEKSFMELSSGIKDALYNTYNVSLTDVHATLSTIAQYQNRTMECAQPEKPLPRLLESLTSNLICKICKVYDPRLPAIQFTAHTPPIQLYLSSHSITALRDISSSFLTALETPETQTTQQFVMAIHQYQEANEKFQSLHSPHQELILPELSLIHVEFMVDELQICLEDDILLQEQEQFTFTFSLHEMSGNFVSTSYLSQTSFKVASCSLYGSLQKERKTPIQLIGTNTKPFEISSELQHYFPQRTKKLIEINWKQISDDSPLYSNVSNEVTIKGNQIICFADLAMLDGFVRLLKRSMVSRQDEKMEKPYEEALKTTQLVIKSLVQKTQQETFFLKGNVSLECFAVLIPSCERNMEVCIAQSNVEISCNSSLSSFSCTGDLGNLMMNLPLLIDEAYFPHVLYIRGSNADARCFVNFEYSWNENSGDSEVRTQIQNANIIIPTCQLNTQSLVINLENSFVTYQSSREQKTQNAILSITNFSITLIDSATHFPILQKTNATIEYLQRENYPQQEINMKIEEINLQISFREFVTLLTLTITKQKLSQTFSNAIEGGKVIIETMKPPQSLHQSSDTISPIISQLTLSVASISLQLLSTDDAKTKTHPMAQLQLDTIRCTTKQFENENFYCSVEIQELQLRDTRKIAKSRPCRDMITHRLPSQRGNQFGTERLQFKIEYENSPTRCPRLGISIDQTYFLIIPDFWAEFIPSVLPLHEHFIEFNKKHQNTQPTPEIILPELQREKMSFEFHCKATDPEICVLEDIERCDTRAFVVLSSIIDISLFLHAMNRGMLLKLNMKGNQMAKCNLIDPTGTFIPIVQPFNIELTSATSTTDETSTTHIVIQSIEATFSFQDYKLALAIYQSWIPSIQKLLETLTPSTTTHNETQQSEKQLLLSNETKLIVKETLNEAREQLKSFASGFTSGKQKAVKIVSLSFHGARLVLINDTIFKTRYNPVLMIHCKASQMTIDWLEGITCEANTVLSVDYYNTAVEVWEPLLEPWNVAIKLLQSNERTEFYIESESIELNISKIFLESLQSALRVLVNVTGNTSQTSSNSEKFLEDYANASPYYIRNESGFSLFYSLSTYKPFTRLHDHEETPLMLNVLGDVSMIDGKSCAWKGRQLGSHQTLFLQFDDPDCRYDYKDHISFHKVGTHKLQVCSNIEEENIATLDVSFRQGCKVITVRSNTRIYNQCDTKMDIMVASPPFYAPKVLSVAPGEILSIPVCFVLNGEFSVAPSNTHQFSDPISLSVTGVVGSCCAQACEGNTENPFDYFLWISVENQSQDRIFHLLPPISVTNALPIPIECFFQYKNTKNKCDHQIIQAGETIAIHLADLSQTLQNGIALSSFGQSENLLSINEPNTAELATFTFRDDSGREFLLRQENIRDSKTFERKITLYCDFWVINRTGLPLLYKEANSLKIEAGQQESCFTLLEGDPRDWYSSQVSITKPFLYSNTNKRIPFCIQVAESEWSSPVELSAEQMFRSISISGNDLYEHVPQYELVVTIKPSPERFWRTREVIIVPRFLLINETDSIIYYHQENFDSKFLLSPHQQLPFHWSDKNKLQFITLTKAPDDDDDDDSYSWSPLFNIDKLGIQTVKLRKQNNKQEFAIISIHVLLDKSSNVTLVIIKENTEFPDLVIDNQLEFPIQISQVHSEIHDNIQPKTIIPFAWDSLQDQAIVKVSILDDIFKYSFDKFMTETISVNTPGGEFQTISVEILADGPTRVLQFTNNETEIIDFTESLVIDDEEFVPLGEERAPIEINFCVSIRRIGLSLIDDVPREVIYGVIEDIEFDFAESKTHQNFLFKLGRLQIDNQLLATAHPIFFYPIITDTQNDGFFILNAIKNISMKSVNYFEHFFVSIGEMDMKADEEVIDNILSFIGAFRSFADTLSLSDEEEETNSLYFTVSTAAMLEMKMFFFDRLIINPIRIHFSTHSGTGSATISQRLPMRGKLLGNIDNAIIDCKGLTLNHPFVSKEELLTQITKHYKQAFLIQMYKIIGSAEILGNPIALLTNMGTGVSDFFTEPMKAIASSPADFGSGLKRGTSSLVHKSVYGIANSAGKVTGGLASLASFFTFDEEYQREWAMVYRSAREPTGAVDGFQRAAQNAGSGVVQALVDVVHSPIQGARTGGATGAIVGTLRGTSGILVKPIVSVFGSASIMAQGIGNTLMNWEDNRSRSRLPRYIGENGVLQVYNKDQAAGHLLLQCIGNGKFENEWYQNSFSVSEGVLVLSDIRMLIVKDSSIVFDLEFTNVKGLQLTREYIIVLPIVGPTRSYFQYSKPIAEKYIFPNDTIEIEPLYEQLISSVTTARERKRK